jgi:hypothetical protein
MQVGAQPWLQSFVRVALVSAELSVPLSVSYAQTQPPGLSDRSPSIPEEKLDAAAAALLRATSLQESYQRRMAEAATSTAKEGLAKVADQEIAKAITDQGLSVKEYASIIEVARNDPSVREKLLRRMDPATK